jgi:hypothetical protein
LLIFTISIIALLAKSLFGRNGHNDPFQTRTQWNDAAHVDVVRSRAGRAGVSDDDFSRAMPPLRQRATPPRARSILLGEKGILFHRAAKHGERHAGPAANGLTAHHEREAKLCI